MPLLKKAHIDSFMLQSKSHWGYAYYPTKVGTMNPGLKCDYFGEMLEACQKEDIEVIAYTSLGWDNVIGMTRPEWSVLKKDGTPLRTPHRGKDYWYWVCVNTDYRNYQLDMVRELASTYPIDGLWMDILETHHNEGLCYCPNCVKDIKELFGKDITREELTIKQTSIWRQKLEDEMYADYCTVLEEVHPGCPVIPNVMTTDVSPEIINAMPYLSTDRPMGSVRNSSIMIRASGKKGNQVMYGNLSRVYDPAPDSKADVAVSQILAHGGRPIIYSEPQNPEDGSLREDFFRILGNAYKDIPLKIPYIKDTRPVEVVGLLASGLTNLLQWNGPMYTYKRIHEVGLNAALDLCTRRHLPVECVLDFNMGDLSRFDVLILADVKYMTDETAEKIREYVKNGGTLICTYMTGLYDENCNMREDFALADIMGLSYERIYDDYADNTIGSYIEMKEYAWSGKLTKIPFECEEDFIAVKSTKGEVLAKHLLPTIHEGTNEFYAWNPPPPGEATNYPAIHLNKVGDGRVIYFSVPIFRYLGSGSQVVAVSIALSMKYWPGMVVGELLEKLLPEPKITVDAPGFIETSYFVQEKDGALVVHFVNTSITGMDGYLVNTDCTLKVHKDLFLPKTANRVFPSEQELDITENGKYFEIVVNSDDIHTIIKMAE